MTDEAREAQELRPCPFCGSQPEYLEGGKYACGNSICPVYKATFTKSQWNTRQPAEQALDARKMANRIRKCFALMRQRLKNEPFERQEFIGAWLDATEAEIFEENDINEARI